MAQPKLSSIADIRNSLLFRVAISLNLIPFATSEVRHEDRFAAILDGSGGQVTDAGPLGGIVNIHVERLAVS